MTPRLSVLTSLSALSLAAVLPLTALAQDIPILDAFATPVKGNGRSPIRVDPIELQLVRGTFSGPSQNGPGGWSEVKADAKGEFSGPAFRSGYAYATVKSDKAKVMLLEAKGHSVVYVNGVPRTGDPYSTGYVSIPVKLNAGDNRMLFAVGRGSFSAVLREVKEPISLDFRDATLPDLIGTEEGLYYAGLVLKNATEADLNNVTIRITAERGATRVTDPGVIPALGVRKVAAAFYVSGTGKYTVQLMQAGKVIATYPLTLRKRTRRETAKRTFISGIDGSAQYYAVQPSTKDGAGQALFLSLHGASVEALGQAEAYSAKTWGHVVAATNRRPFGFDWEEIGRLDALEVLKAAREEYRTDPTKTYLTGHSMGGHGTWQLGATFPSQFAAIAPSAGWISFFTYGGGVRQPAGKIGDLLNRASNPSDTLALKQNLAEPAIYILHGDADDNVPVSEAREMRKQLYTMHKRLDGHEQPGAGHWWDASPEPGADAVDWAPIFAMFSTSRLPASEEVRHVDFSTFSPGISATSHWAKIDQQIKPLAISRVVLDAEPFSRRIVGTTENVSRLTLELDALIQGPELILELDGKKLTLPWPKRGGQVSLYKALDGWQLSSSPSLKEKGAHRNGGFKDIFKNRVMFVYGTKGKPDENEWAKAKARFDAETFWVRGNGSVDVISDVEFDARAARDRNVLLYGNKQTNGAWATLLANSPVQVSNGSFSADGKQVDGDDQVVLFIRPREDSNVASVAAIAPTGMVGARLSERLPLFVSGAAFPDVYAINSSMLEKGLDGVVWTGFFGNDWSVIGGDFAWKE